jgi:hypothetical protein
MNKKIETAMRLIQSGDQRKYFQGLCLLMEVYEESPTDLDPLAKCLIESTVKPVVKSVEKNLGVPVFDENDAA